MSYAYRLSVANHEAAHLVAAASLGAEILGVRICTETGKDVLNGTRTRKVAGYCAADHAHPVKNALIGLAGWAWEVEFDSSPSGAQDHADVQLELSRSWVVEKYGDCFDQVKADALTFVREHEQLIRDTGVEILKAAKPDGTLRKRPWKLLEASLRNRFRRKY